MWIMKVMFSNKLNWFNISNKGLGNNWDRERR